MLMKLELTTCLYFVFPAYKKLDLLSEKQKSKNYINSKITVNFLNKNNLIFTPLCEKLNYVHTLLNNYVSI
jgi:hypothetical protein